MTVSRALRNDPSISAGTIRRIQLLAQALGYRPNPLVTALMSEVRTRRPTGDHTVIAYLNTWWPKSTWEACNTKTGQFRGAMKRAGELGFRLENFWVNQPAMTPARLSGILKARGIRGVLVGPLQHQHTIDGFPWGDFAMATIGYSLHAPAIPRACHAHFRGMHRSMEELIGCGYRRVGYVSSRDSEDRVDSLWGAAYRFMQHRFPGKDRLEPLLFAEDAEIGPLEEWITAVRPDAIVCALQGVHGMLRKLGREIPGDLGFVQLDLPVHLKQANICGIDQSSEIVGAGAVDLIASQLYTNASGVPTHPITHLIEGTWIAGGTVECRRQPGAGHSTTARPGSGLGRPSRPGVGGEQARDATADRRRSGPAPLAHKWRAPAEGRAAPETAR